MTTFTEIEAKKLIEQARGFALTVMPYAVGGGKGNSVDRTCEIAAEAVDLVGCVVRMLASRACKPPRGRVLWSMVGEIFCVGSTRASMICVAYGHDPNLHVRSLR